MITYLIISIILGTIVQGESGVEDTNPITNRNKSIVIFLQIKIRLLFDMQLRTNFGPKTPI